jgi:ketosteroid isomerase-like protein
MISRFSLLPILALVFATTSTAQAQGGTPDPERAAVRQVILEMAAHVQAGKWASADSLFATRGVHVLTDTAGLHSWAEYRDSRLKPELARYTSPRLAHTGVEAQVRGNVAWVAFRQEISAAAAGSPAARVGRGSAVLEKLDGRWTIVHLHMSR